MERDKQKIPDRTIKKRLFAETRFMVYLQIVVVDPIQSQPGKWISPACYLPPKEVSEMFIAALHKSIIDAIFPMVMGKKPLMKNSAEFN